MRFFLLLASFIMMSSAFGGSLYSDRPLWKKRDLRVCFAGGENEKRELEAHHARISDWSRSDKKSVQRWISEEYSLQRTGIGFSGWSDCEKDQSADVVIFYGKSSLKTWLLQGGIRGESTIGPDSYLELDGYPKAQSYVWLRSDGMSKGTVVHEFGHSLGLHHEHMRLEAIDDPACEKVERAGRDFVYSRAAIHGSYDAQSVMNYCMLHGKNGKKSGLSVGDVGLLRFLYP